MYASTKLVTRRTPSEYNFQKYNFSSLFQCFTFENYYFINTKYIPILNLSFVLLFLVKKGIPLFFLRFCLFLCPLTYVGVNFHEYVCEMSAFTVVCMELSSCTQSPCYRFRCRLQLLQEAYGNVRWGACSDFTDVCIFKSVVVLFFIFRLEVLAWTWLLLTDW